MSNVPAVRTEVKQTTQEIIQLVSFELGGEEYGVDVLTVREIIRMPSITKMPNTHDYVGGIINLRGTVVPIISLRKRFGLCESECDNNSRILVMEVGNGMTGFVVDSVSEVIRIHSNEIQPPPSLVLSGGISQEFISGVFNHAERLLIIVDLGRLFSDNELEYIQEIQ
ncbi:MAG: purine-binding chemotaxis protein CheW [Desulfuromonadales bacterium]|nr:purine-binding chemotaxis protein CheW [Desulfuromonadales bacterium]